MGLCGQIISPLPVGQVQVGDSDRGFTVCSKFMTVDGMFTQVGSHNHHPRSERFEGEMVINAVDPNLTRSFTESFEKDIAAAKRCETVADIGVPEPGLGALALKYFFDAF